MACPHPEHPPHPEQRLPKHLASKLTADLRRALQHPCRRLILRSLHGHVQKLNPAEAGESGLVPCSTPCAGYHMRILARAGLVEEDGSASSEGSTRRYFSSAIEKQTLVLEVLKQTEEPDNRFLARPATSSAA